MRERERLKERQTDRQTDRHSLAEKKKKEKKLLLGHGDCNTVTRVALSKCSPQKCIPKQADNLISPPVYNGVFN